jgi:C4-dicarboxylate transporter, DcuC family
MTPETFTAIAVLVIFAGAAVLMYLGRLPALLALPLMAIAIAVAARIPTTEILTRIIEGGPDLKEGLLRLRLPIITVILGAILAELMKRGGVAEALVKRAAELGGDRPLLVALLLTAVVALLFTTLGGLGAVIMVATIVFPILLSLGLSPILVGGLFLMGMSLGGIFNLANWSLYRELHLSTTTILSFALSIGLIFIFTTIVFAIAEIRRGRRAFWAVAAPVEERRPVNFFAMLTPLVPLVLVLSFSLRKLITHDANAFEFPITAAMMIGIVWGIVTTWQRGAVANNLSRAIHEGIGNVAPAVALMLGIGMLMTAVMHPNVTSALKPILEHILPRTALLFVIGFSFFAPLALYRGPLNLYGMGLGLGQMMAAVMSPASVMAALLSVGQIQGVCDPTNTHNVWIANYLGLDVNLILRRTLPYVWCGVILALIIGAIMFMR